MTTEDTLEETGSDFRETANVLLEVFRCGYFSIVRKCKNITDIGTPASVSLNDEAVEKREEKHKDVIGFFHTHPEKAEYISNIDTATAMAYSYSFGKRILMIIQTCSGWEKAWYLNDKEIVCNAKVVRLPFGYYLVFVP